MPPLVAAAALLVVRTSPAPRPRLCPSRRTRPAAARAAPLRALPRRLELWPQRLAAVEGTPPPSSAPPAPGSSSDLDAGSGGGDGGGDGGGGTDLGWLRVFPHVLTASMANFLFGYHIGVMNGPIEDIAQELGFQGNPFLQGLVCDSLDEMLLGRFLVGIGIGVNTVLVPLYISEVAPTKYRGFLGTLCQIGTCLGIIGALSLGIPSESDPHWWRTMLYSACVPGFLIVVGMQFAVESPRWLAKVGRFDDARKVVESLWEPSEVDKSMEEIKAVVSNDDSQSSWSDLLVEPHNRVALIGGSLFFLQQFAGINGVLYFSSLTFRDVGITSGALASLYVGIANFGGAVVASNLMDKQGRKNLLIGSYLGMAFAMLLIVYGISFPLDEGVAHSLSITGTLLYIFTFALGAGPVTGIIIPELSSARTRSKVMGFSFTVHWICNFLVGLYFLELVNKFGVGAVYAGFGVVSLLTVLFAYNFIVETKGRSLEEIEMSMSPSTPRKQE
ncbi:unnamed protein product [Urochloa humidicola]